MGEAKTPKRRSGGTAARRGAEPASETAQTRRPAPRPTDGRIRLAHLRHGLRRQIESLSAALEATAPATVARRSSKTRPMDDIYRWFIDLLGVADIDLNAAVGAVTKLTTPQAIAAFADELNDAPGFSGDRLALTPGNLANVKIIRDILRAIVTWYQDNGWRVI